jgi:TolB protein
VSFNGNYNTTPTWSPKRDKHLIAYTTRDGSSYDIVVLDIDSKQMTRITQNEGQNEEPAFSPNGRVIAYARQGVGVFLANADGTGSSTKVWSGSATGVDWGPAPARAGSARRMASERACERPPQRHRARRERARARRLAFPWSGRLLHR